MQNIPDKLSRQYYLKKLNVYNIYNKILLIVLDIFLKVSVNQNKFLMYGSLQK